jgi:Legume-like lectin family
MKTAHIRHPQAGPQAVLRSACSNFLVLVNWLESDLADHRGSRFIPHWDLGGGMIVKQSFMRLTADRLHQIGHLWSRSPLETDNFSLLMKFRVSGGHASLYGESLALYIGSDSGYSEGNLYGIRPDFTGMIIAIDTNSADDNAGVAHKDVSVLANNGSLNRMQVLHAAQGCAATLRYHEARDDFNVLKASRLRVSYDAATEVSLDYLFTIVLQYK